MYVLIVLLFVENGFVVVLVGESVARRNEVPVAGRYLYGCTVAGTIIK